jgi:hypothetical protein
MKPRRPPLKVLLPSPPSRTKAISRQSLPSSRSKPRGFIDTLCRKGSPATWPGFFCHLHGGFDESMVCAADCHSHRAGNCDLGNGSASLVRYRAWPWPSTVRAVDIRPARRSPPKGRPLLLSYLPSHPGGARGPHLACRTAFAELRWDTRRNSH